MSLMDLGRRDSGRDPGAPGEGFQLLGSVVSGEVRTDSVAGWRAWSARDEVRQIPG